MNHKQAVDLRAAEKYVLGELPEAHRLEYEEHYFECAECAIDLQAAAAFVGASREVFRQDAAAAFAAALAAARKGQGASVPATWLQRFRWAFAAVPAFAALVLVIAVGYQNIRTPRPLAGPDSPTFDLGASGTRGGETPANGTPFRIHAKDGFSVAFDFTPRAPFAAYICQLQDASGRVLLQVAVPQEKANQRYVLHLPGGVVSAPGSYRVVMLGADAAGHAASGGDVQHFVFTLAIQQ